ncbi:Peptidase C19 ubiquitin carboxyl-terminal hydrolase, partial [Trinorchestia longiramus]
ETDTLFSTHWPPNADCFSEDSKDSDSHRCGAELSRGPTVDAAAVTLPPTECCMDEDAGEDLATLLLPSSSPPSPRVVMKHQPDEQSRGSGESHEDGCEDSGATSPKSSVSSSSVDSHLVNLRLQPIPEEVLLHAASSSLLRDRQEKELLGAARVKQRRLLAASQASMNTGPTSSVPSAGNNQDDDDDIRMEEDFDEFDRRNGEKDDISVDADSTFSSQSNLVTSAQSSRRPSSSNRVVSFNSNSCGMLVSSSSDSAEADASECSASDETEGLSNNNLPGRSPLPLPDVLQNTIDARETSKMVTSSDVSSTMDSSETKGSDVSLDVNVLDIMKESRTSNVNVLVTENQPNNALVFDSEKYAKFDKAKLKDTLDNLGHDVGDSTLKDNSFMSLSKKSLVLKDLTVNGKKGKRSNCLLDQSVPIEGILNDLQDNSKIIANKRMRLDEKNIQLELERCQQLQESSSSSSSTSGSSSDVGQSGSSSSTSGVPSSPKPQECVSNIARVAAAAAAADCAQASGSMSVAERNAARDLRLADESWKSFIGEGEGSVLMDTFYGQFKSCLVCSVCGHSSVKFDPFGTLSVPLPHANETQIVVTYVSCDKSPALRCLVTLNKMADVKDMKAAIVQLLTQDHARRTSSARPVAATSGSSSSCTTLSSVDSPVKMEEEETMAVDSKVDAGDTTKVNNATDDDKMSKRDDIRMPQKSKRRKNSLSKPPEASQLVVAEVLDNHVAKILDDSILTKYVNQTSRSVYAFHLPSTGSSPPPLPPNPSTRCKARLSPIPMPDVVPLPEESGAYGSTSPGLKGGSKNCGPQSKEGPNSSPSATPSSSETPSSSHHHSSSPCKRVCCLLSSSGFQVSPLSCALSQSPESSMPTATDLPFKLLPGLRSHQGGIDGGNAGCGYPDPNAVVKPFVINAVPTNLTTGGGVIGGAGGTTTSPMGYPPASVSLSPNNVPSSSMRESNRGSEGAEEGGEWKTCNICLEEMCQTELKTHDHCYDCLLCETCIDMSVKHHGSEADTGGALPCPVCQASLTRDSLIPVARRLAHKPKPRLLRVCVVFRLDADSADNNKRATSLLGHPRLVLLPSSLPLANLWSSLQHCIPPGANCQLLLVDGRGYNCSRCLFVSHCRGCDVSNCPGPRSGGNSSGDNNPTVHLQAGDTVCVRFTRLTAMQRHFLSATKEHPSLALRRQDSPLTLYDCLRTFTRSEKLESSESWYCPECECKQPATKTVSVWKCPPFLILHLERFLFHGTSSSKLDDKVIFPIENLDMGEYFGGRSPGPQLYNLYGVVCHVGVVQAGHYTSLVQSPVSGAWRYFNDENVTARKPSEDEYSSAYLLFYHRNDLPFRLHLPREFSFLSKRDSTAPASEPLRASQSSPIIDITGDDDAGDSAATDDMSAQDISNNSPRTELESSASVSSKKSSTRTCVAAADEGFPCNDDVKKCEGKLNVNSTKSEEAAAHVDGLAPLEGGVLDDWLTDASVHIEGSSVSRSPQSTALKSPAHSSCSLSKRKDIPCQSESSISNSTNVPRITSSNASACQNNPITCTQKTVGSSSTSSVSQSSDVAPWPSSEMEECTSSEQVGGVSSSSGCGAGSRNGAAKQGNGNFADSCSQSSNVDLEATESDLH